eukprot:gene18110-biopygen30586
MSSDLQQVVLPRTAKGTGTRAFCQACQIATGLAPPDETNRNRSARLPPGTIIDGRVQVCYWCQAPDHWARQCPQLAEVQRDRDQDRGRPQNDHPPPAPAPAPTPNSPPAKPAPKHAPEPRAPGQAPAEQAATSSTLDPFDDADELSKMLMEGNEGTTAATSLVAPLSHQTSSQPTAPPFAVGDLVWTLVSGPDGTSPLIWSASTVHAVTQRTIKTRGEGWISGEIRSKKWAMEIRPRQPGDEPPAPPTPTRGRSAAPLDSSLERSPLSDLIGRKRRAARPTPPVTLRGGASRQLVVGTASGTAHDKAAAAGLPPPPKIAETETNYKNRKATPPHQRPDAAAGGGPPRADSATRRSPATARPSRRRHRAGWQEKCRSRTGRRPRNPNLLLWNAQGLLTGGRVRHKWLELHRIVTDAAAEGAPIDVVAVVEAHLDPLIGDGEVSLPGYQPPLRCERDPAVSKHPDGRSRKAKGGVIVWVRDGLLIQDAIADAAESYELVAFSVAETRYVVLYKSDAAVFSEALHSRLSQERHGQERFICAGDFNSNLDAKKPRGGPLMRHMRHQLQLHQFVKFPTYHRRTKGGKLLQKSRLDHIWANITCRCAVQHSLIRESDHMGVRVSYPPGAREQKRPRAIYRRRWAKLDEQAAVEIIDRHILPLAPDKMLRPHLAEHAREEMARRGVGRAEPPRPVPQLVDDDRVGARRHLDSALRAWDAAWREIKRTLVPKQRVRLPKPGTKKLPWISSATRAKQRERNRRQRQYAKNWDDEEAQKAVQDARAAVRKGLEEDSRAYMQSKWAAAGQRAGRPDYWRIFDSFAGRKVRARVQPGGTPDACNETFIRKVTKLREPLLTTPPAAPTPKDVPTMTLFGEITEVHVLQALRDSKPKKSSGIDEVPMTALKQVGPRVAQHICTLANAVQAAQRWPQEWKRAQVSPLWKKKGCRQDPRNYRPLAMLPSISRLVERLFSEQLKEHVRAAGVLPDFQHGFRKGHDCEKALLELIDWTAMRRERGDHVVVVSADYSAAFDTLDHEVLIHKLEALVGLRGPALQLLRDYLHDRRQRCLIHGKPPSPWSAPMAFGVPQGSVLGPLLFNLYCADIGDHVRGAKLIQYADDVTLCVAAPTLDQVRRSMNAALREFEQYSNANRLAPQPAKTQLLLCTATRRQHELQEFACELAGQQLRPAAVIKILGTLIEPTLSWKAHAAAAAGRADAATAQIRRHTSWLSVADRAYLASALALPHLDYCQSAMTGASAAATNTLIRAYHRAARMAARMERQGFRRRAPLPTERSEPAMRLTGWPVWERRRRATAAAVACGVWAARAADGAHAAARQSKAASILRQRSACGISTVFSGERNHARRRHARRPGRTPSRTYILSVTMRSGRGSVSSTCNIAVTSARALVCSPVTVRAQLRESPCA